LVTEREQKMQKEEAWEGCCGDWSSPGLSLGLKVGLQLTAEGVLQEGVLADGVEDRIEHPVEETQHHQQQQDRQCLQELCHLPGTQG
jgi:hypothetical protein